MDVFLFVRFPNARKSSLGENQSLFSVNKSCEHKNEIRFEGFHASHFASVFAFQSVKPEPVNWQASIEFA